MVDIKERIINAHVNLTLAQSFNDINIEGIRKLLNELIYDNLILNKDIFKKHLDVNRELDDNGYLSIRCGLYLVTKTLVDSELGFCDPEQIEYELVELEENTREKFCSSLEENCNKED